MLSRMPNRPWLSLLQATILGPFLGSLVVSVWLALLEFNQSSWILLADAIPVTLFAYIAVAPLALLYAAPLLWLAIRFRVATPLVAVVVALAPGLALLASSSRSSALDALPISISAGVALVFVVRAYRRSDAN